MSDKETSKGRKFFYVKMLYPYRYLIVGSIISLIILTNLGMLLPWMLKIIIDRVLGSSDVSLLYVILGSIVLIYLMRNIFLYISHYLIFYISQRFLFDVRKRLFKHLQSLSLRFYGEYRTGKLISNIMNDVQLMQQMVSQSAAGAIVNIFMIAFIAGVLFYMSPIAAGAALAMVPLQFLNFLYFKEQIKKDALTLREKMSEISANLAETINGIKVVKSFGRERSENRSFVSNIRPAMDITITLSMKGVYCWMVAELINMFSIVFVLGTGGVLVMKGQMTIGAFVAFYTYLGMLLNPIIQLSNLSNVISQGLAGATRIMDLLSKVPEIKEKEKPVFLDDIEGRISFRNVNFGYNSEQEVVKNFTLDINPGEKVALVGPSGSGKSTIANLVMRFYDVTGGEITVDGRDIRNLSLDSYRKRTGVVLQDSFLFSGTIEENIAYSKREWTPEEIRNAGKMAHLDEFIERLDDGYNTEIGENGVMLSGGQKQRISIARALLKDPRILILDEATSALDTVSEYYVQKALDNLMKDRTTIIIAHRLSTIKNADRIVVMQDGEIRQVGSHRELMASEGIYREMYQTQEDAFNGSCENTGERKNFVAA